jgi:hypothetical protein
MATPYDDGNPLRRKRWNPYVVGIGIGVLSWITFLTMDKALGTSSSFVHVSGLVETVAGQGGKVLGPAANSYYAKEITEKTPMFDWQVFLVIGVLIGALVSSRLSGDRTTECVPGLWSWRFGPSKAKRYAAAFAGGFVMLFGARMAGGCTSGHGISGGLQLALSSWTFFMAMFASGVFVAFALFGKGGRHHVA